MKGNAVILLTSEFPPGPGGIGNHAFNLAKWLTHHGKNVEVWTSSDSEYSEKEILFDRQQTFNVVRYKKVAGKLKTYRDLISRLNVKINSSETTQVISSGMVPLLLGGLLKIFYRKRNKFVAVVHGLDINPANFFLKQIVRFFLNKYDKVIAVSNYTASYIPSGTLFKTIVINNGVDIGKFTNSNTNSSTDSKSKPKGTPSLITVGTVWERKGQINVVRALPEIIKQYPFVHYHIVGKHNDLSGVLKLAAALNVEGNISIHGPIADEELESILSQSDIFIMLSKQTSNGDFEGFGIAILEANSLGVPAIGSKNCGIEDAIVHDKTGILVDSSDVSQIASAVKRIAERRTEYSINARQFANNCSWQIVIDKYLKVLNN